MKTDWEELARDLAPVEVQTDRTAVRRKSRDFFWYSPILNAELKTCFGDLVARPADAGELAHVLAAAYAQDAPMVLRGGGTGNYGQAVPLDGGLIVETTKMNRILEIGAAHVRAEAGAKIADINAALADKGQELAMFPSTQDIATVGGFVAGGSSGIGSVAHGMLRDPGNLIALTALSVEAAPRTVTFDGPEALHIHHAWGMNGAIADVTLRTVPARDWVGAIASFDSYQAAFAAGLALAHENRIAPKLVSTVDARIAGFFPRLEGHIQAERDLLVTMVPAENLEALRDLVAGAGGTLDLHLTEAERTEANLPHVFEFSYNHTTLQVLKSDRSATYQQIGCPVPPDPDQVAKVRAALADDVWMHHEFARNGGQIVAFDLPIIWFSTPERLEQINDIYAAHGFAVYDAHTWHVEGGGLKNVDYTHLAWKKRMDPKGLLNSAKSRVWDDIRHLSPEEIENLGGTRECT